MKLVILDKDGTLTEPRSGARFVSQPDDQQLIEGVLERVAELVEAGALLIVASNQGGVEAKYKTLESAIAEMLYLYSLFPPRTFQRGYFCPDFEGRDCWVVEPNEVDFGGAFKIIDNYVEGSYRKPEPGMIKAAIRFVKELHPNTELQVTSVGDRLEDLEAAQNAGIEYLHVSDWLGGGLDLQ